jgi:phage terminase Nu1 subunit (DNA packaging protein)
MIPRGKKRKEKNKMAKKRVITYREMVKDNTEEIESTEYVETEYVQNLLETIGDAVDRIINMKLFEKAFEDGSNEEIDNVCNELCDLQEMLL